MTDVATRTMDALGTTAVVAVTDPYRAGQAQSMVRGELDAIDRACSRFRLDAELGRVNEADGRWTRVSSLLFEALTVACDVAEETSGAVDPTVGNALAKLGYDRDFADVAPVARGTDDRPAGVPGWWCIELDARQRSVRVPAGTEIDLGASAKALAADRGAARVAEALGCGALVSIGGDVATAGTAPAGGWAVGIAGESAAAPEHVQQVVAIRAGGLASSSTTVRTWRRGSEVRHHIVDPSSGTCATAYWHLVSAAGRSCVEANAASTAAMVWGAAALVRLERLGRPARLVRADGRVVTANGWPDDHADPRRGVGA